jgi:hypothetical protein
LRSSLGACEFGRGQLIRQRLDAILLSTPHPVGAKSAWLALYESELSFVSLSHPSRSMLDLVQIFNDVRRRRQRAELTGQLQQKCLDFPEGRAIRNPRVLPSHTTSHLRLTQIWRYRVLILSAKDKISFEQKDACGGKRFRGTSMNPKGVKHATAGPALCDGQLDATSYFLLKMLI